MEENVPKYCPQDLRPLLQGYYETGRLQIAKYGQSRAPKGAGCKYRLDGRASCPTRCFVGALIPDEAYDETGEYGLCHVEIDHHGRWQSPSRGLVRMLEAAGIPSDHHVREFLVRMQRAHDKADGALDAISRIDEVAAEYGLEVVSG